MGTALLGGWLDAGLDPAQRAGRRSEASSDALRPLVERYGVRHADSGSAGNLRRRPPGGEAADDGRGAARLGRRADAGQPRDLDRGRHDRRPDRAASRRAAGGAGHAQHAGADRPRHHRRLCQRARHRRASGTAEELLSASGPVEWVEAEALIDAVTGVSGSGPAYVFYLAECLAKAGEAAGLPADLAMRLARHTVAGAGELMIRSRRDASQAPPERHLAERHDAGGARSADGRGRAGAADAPRGGRGARRGPRNCPSKDLNEIAAGGAGAAASADRLRRLHEGRHPRRHDRRGGAVSRSPQAGDPARHRFRRRDWRARNPRPRSPALQARQTWSAGR